MHNFLNLKPYRPTRLVKIGFRNGDLKLRIHTASKGQPIYPCMTLSHRWGTEPFLKLITRNIRSMQRGFEVSDLPKTFSDTIATAQRFGVQCLWIDSLCILQDLKEDWRHEAA